MKKFLSLFVLLHFCVSGKINFVLPKPNAQGGPLTKEMLSVLKFEFNIDVFVESGTGCGETTRNAAEIFNKVYSVELYEPLYKKAKEELASFKNVYLYFGDSTKVFSEILKTVDPREKVLFWLDAHYSGEGTAGKDSECPLFGELDSIKLFNKSNSYILIDDFMCTHGDGYFDFLYNKLLDINQHRVIIGDIFFSLPDVKKDSFSSVLKSFSKLVMIDNINFRSCIKNIINCNLLERQTIKAYANIARYDHLYIYKFLYGLISLSRNKVEKGNRYLDEAIKRGLPLVFKNYERVFRC